MRRRLRSHARLVGRAAGGAAPRAGAPHARPRRLRRAARQRPCAARARYHHPHHLQHTISHVTIILSCTSPSYHNLHYLHNIVVTYITLLSLPSPSAYHHYHHPHLYISSLYHWVTLWPKRIKRFWYFYTFNPKSFASTLLSYILHIFYYRTATTASS